ncbi:MAG: aminodeoxychorismate/anthranilate synthase component II [Bauldia sp.]|jgi:anthranilate synthase component 2|nr:aminodeoxychorismate/anthranilate synthase component II [Bauldia sp.]
MTHLVIDNYDSFTYNLVHYLGELGADIVVRRNDKITVDEIVALDPESIILSPGPCSPNEAGICLDLVGSVADTIPVFGVCLGHQTIGQVFGGEVVRAPSQMHGKISTISHSGRGVFAGIPDDFKATRYHSLTVDAASIPPALEVTAESEDGVVMGLMHRTLPIHSVQFHPESIASEHGHKILQNFLDLAAAWNARHRRRSVA